MMAIACPNSGFTSERSISTNNTFPQNGHSGEVYSAVGAVERVASHVMIQSCLGQWGDHLRLEAGPHIHTVEEEKKGQNHRGLLARVGLSRAY